MTKKGHSGKCIACGMQFLNHCLLMIQELQNQKEKTEKRKKALRQFFDETNDKRAPFGGNEKNKEVILRSLDEVKWILQLQTASVTLQKYRCVQAVTREMKKEKKDVFNEISSPNKFWTSPYLVHG